MLTTTYHLVRSWIPTSNSTDSNSIYPPILKKCATTLDTATSVALLLIAAIANEKARNHIPSALLKEIPHSITDLTKRYNGMIWAACALASVGLQLFCALALKIDTQQQNNPTIIPPDHSGSGNGDEGISPPPPPGGSPGESPGITKDVTDTPAASPLLRPFPQSERKIPRKLHALKRSASVASFFSKFPQAKELLAPAEDSFKGNLYRQVSNVRLLGGPARNHTQSIQQPTPPTPEPLVNRIQFVLPATQELKRRKDALKSTSERELRFPPPSTGKNVLNKLRRTQSFPVMSPIKFEYDPTWDEENITQISELSGNGDQQ